VSFAAITLCVASQRVLTFHYRLNPETFGYTLVLFTLGTQSDIDENVAVMLTAS